MDSYSADSDLTPTDLTPAYLSDKLAPQKLLQELNISKAGMGFQNERQ